MAKTKKLLLTGLSIALVAIIAVFGTVAFFTDTDEDVNVMTIGNVQIVQNEQERVKDTNGNYTDELQEYSGVKNLMPYVTLGNTTKENVTVGDYTIQMRDKSVQNYVDKIVTVTNTGKSNAYVRTIIAIPTISGVAADGAYDNWLHWNGVSDTDTSPENGWMWGDQNTEWPGNEGTWDSVENVEINGKTYTLFIATNKNILKPDKTTAPNLVGVYLDSRVDCETLADGSLNYYITINDVKYDLGDIANLEILVASQAVQADGFSDAWTALDKAFGDITNDNHPWAPTSVTTPEELVAAFKKGGEIILQNDIPLEEGLTVAEGTEVYLNMNGQTITAKDVSVDPVFYTFKDSKLTIDGNGKVELSNPSMSLIFPGGDVIIENGTFTRNVPSGTPAKEVGALFVGAKVSPWGSQTVTINGGYFDGGYYDTNAADIDEILAGTKEFKETEDDIAKRGNSKDANAVRVALKNNIQRTLNLSYNLMKVYGGTFVGMNPAWGDEGCMLPTTPNYLRPWSYYQGALLDGQQFNENKIVLPEGYSIDKSTTTDNRPAYTVNYSK